MKPKKDNKVNSELKRREQYNNLARQNTQVLSRIVPPANPQLSNYNPNKVRISTLPSPRILQSFDVLSNTRHQNETYSHASHNILDTNATSSIQVEPRISNISLPSSYTLNNNYKHSHYRNDNNNHNNNAGNNHTNTTGINNINGQVDNIVHSNDVSTPITTLPPPHPLPNTTFTNTPTTSTTAYKNNTYANGISNSSNLHQSYHIHNDNNGGTYTSDTNMTQLSTSIQNNTSPKIITQNSIPHANVKTTVNHRQSVISNMTNHSFINPLTQTPTQSQTPSLKIIKPPTAVWLSDDTMNIEDISPLMPPPLPKATTTTTQHQNQQLFMSNDNNSNNNSSGSSSNSHHDINGNQLSSANLKNITINNNSISNSSSSSHSNSGKERSINDTHSEIQNKKRLSSSSTTTTPITPSLPISWKKSLQMSSGNTSNHHRISTSTTKSSDTDSPFTRLKKLPKLNQSSLSTSKTPNGGVHHATPTTSTTSHHKSPENSSSSSSSGSNNNGIIRNGSSISKKSNNTLNMKTPTSKRKISPNSLNGSLNNNNNNNNSGSSSNSKKRAMVIDIDDTSSSSSSSSSSSDTSTSNSGGGNSDDDNYDNEDPFHRHTMTSSITNTTSSSCNNNNNNDEDGQSSLLDSVLYTYQHTDKDTSENNVLSIYETIFSDYIQPHDRYYVPLVVEDNTGLKDTTTSTTTTTTSNTDKDISEDINASINESCDINLALTVNEWQDNGIHSQCNMSSPDDVMTSFVEYDDIHIDHTHTYDSDEGYLI